MGNKHLLPQENEEFLDRLGLTEIDKKVYIGTLDGGLVSLGELQQFTEISDLGQILESVRDLIDIGLIKKAQGTMRRYYATLPFFRETLSVEREFKFALEAMLQSLSQSKEQTKQNRERIMAVKFPQLIDSLLDEYYQEILSPVISDIQQIREDTKSNIMPFIKEVDAENSSITEEINLMLKPLQNYAQLLNQKFDLALTEEEGQLKQYLTTRKQNRLNILKNAHNAIGSHLEMISTEITELSKQLRSLDGSIQERTANLQETSNIINTGVENFKTSLDTVSNAKKEIQAELVVAREQVKRAIRNNSTEGETEAVVDDIFVNLTEKIKAVNLSAEGMKSSLDTITTAVSSGVASLTQLSTEFDQTINSIDNRLNSIFDQLKDEMTTSFNQLNIDDEESIQLLKEQLEIEIQQLADSIKEEGEGVRSKLNDHIKSVQNQQEIIMKRHQEVLSKLYNRPVEIVKPFLDTWLDTIEPIIEDFKQKSDAALQDILEPILELEEGTFSTLTERIGFVKAMIEGRSNDLQQVLNFAKNFDFTKTADTSVVVGLPAIYASLTDLLLRTKSKVTVVMPHLDLELVEIARTLKSRIRISFVTDVDPDKDARLIKKLDEMGRINLRHYPDRNLYACIRDSEEIIFGYIKDGEETVGIRSSTPSIVELLEDRLNETVIRNSKPI